MSLVKEQKPISRKGFSSSAENTTIFSLRCETRCHISGLTFSLTVCSREMFLFQGCQACFKCPRRIRSRAILSHAWEWPKHMLPPKSLSNKTSQWRPRSMHPGYFFLFSVPKICPSPFSRFHNVFFPRRDDDGSTDKSSFFISQFYAPIGAKKLPGTRRRGNVPK